MTRGSLSKGPKTWRADMLYLFALIFSVLAFLFSASVFFTRSLIRQVALFALVALASSAIFAAEGQELVGVLQIIVFVGGISTYFMLSFDAKEESASSAKRKVALAASIALVGSILAYAALSASYAPAASNSSSFSSASAQMLSLYYAVFYIILIMLLACAAGSVILIKKSEKARS
ncbi:MAG: NADH-quinone oxidoreductase subunit J [Candidatus Micrarchaeaceae archaeon]